MLLRYILFFVLAYAFARFVGGLIEMGRRAARSSMTGDRGGPGPHLEGRDVEDADFEILEEKPPEEEPPAG